MTTTKQHQRQQYRDRTGKYSEVNKCQRCGKSAGVDYCSDARTDTNVLGVSIGDDALCLCDKCGSLMADMDDYRFLIEIRREDYGNLPRGKDAPLTNADVLSARAAAGMCDTGEMAATMDEAREAMSARIDKAMTDTQAARDFSLCNDAALSAAADQYEDWLHWRWTCGIGEF